MIATRPRSAESASIIAMSAAISVSTSFTAARYGEPMAVFQPKAWPAPSGAAKCTKSSDRFGCKASQLVEWSRAMREVRVMAKRSTFPLPSSLPSRSISPSASSKLCTRIENFPLVAMMAVVTPRLCATSNMLVTYEPCFLQSVPPWRAAGGSIFSVHPCPSGPAIGRLVAMET